MLNININKLLNWVALVVIAALILFIFFNRKPSTAPSVVKDGTEFVDSTDTYHIVYTDDDFKALKKENKALYDSLKSCKEEINHLLEFKYSKKYDTGVVEVEKKEENVYSLLDSLETKTFEYQGETNDTFQYKLTINSKLEPDWYRIQMDISDRFTIVNRNVEGNNELTITPGTNGVSISDVTTFNKKEKKNIFRNFSIGPAITAGYDPINNNLGVVVGFGISYNIFGK